MTNDTGENEYERLLRRIAAELRVTSPHAFEHAPGAESSSTEDAAALVAVDAVVSPFPVVTQALSTFIYLHYYLGEASTSAHDRRTDTGLPIVLREDPAFGAELRRANRGAGFAEAGWQVVGHAGGAALVRKNRISLLATSADIEGGTVPAVGESVAIRFPPERPYAYPDYYMAVGNGGPAAGESGRPIVRIYFNVRASGAPILLGVLTSRLGAALSRFSVKVLNHPASFPRPDAAVAYFSRDEFVTARPLLTEAVQKIAPHLDSRVPAFTMAVAPGVGFAEEPVSGDGRRLSFGQHRCGLVARGLACAFAGGADDAGTRFRYVARQFEAANVDLARPYLAGGSVRLEWSIHNQMRLSIHDHQMGCR
jgi:HopA1 effector protein family